MEIFTKKIGFLSIKNSKINLVQSLRLFWNALRHQNLPISVEKYVFGHFYTLRIAFPVKTDVKKVVLMVLTVKQTSDSKSTVQITLSSFFETSGNL